MLQALKKRIRASAQASSTLIGILVFVVLFYLVVIVRYNFKEAINISNLGAGDQALIASVDASTEGGLKLAGIGPIVMAAVFLMSLVLGLIVFSSRMG